MYRLRDGIVCIAQATDDGCQNVAAVDTATGNRWSIPGKYVKDVFRIALGSDEPPSGEYLAAEGHDLVGEFEERVDPLLRDALVRLDEQFMWFLAPLLEEEGKRGIYASFLDAHASRKVIRMDLLQVPLVPAAGFARAMRIGGGNRQLSILLLGDDDLLSIPLAMMGHRVTVLDLDPFVLALLKQVTAQQQIPPIRIVHQDMLDPFPPEWEEAYDVFCADPPEEPRMWNATLHRGLRCLKPDGRGYVSLCDPIGRLASDQATSLGGRLVEVWRRMSHYYTPGSMRVEPAVEDIRVFQPPRQRNLLRPLGEAIPSDRLSEYDTQLDFSLDVFQCQGITDQKGIAAKIREVFKQTAGYQVQQGHASNGDWWQFHHGSEVSVVVTGEPRTRYVSIDYRSRTGACRRDLLQAVMEGAAPARYQLVYHYRGEGIAEQAEGAVVRR